MNDFSFCPWCQRREGIVLATGDYQCLSCRGIWKIVLSAQGLPIRIVSAIITSRPEWRGICIIEEQ